MNSHLSFKKKMSDLQKHSNPKSTAHGRLVFPCQFGLLALI